MYPNLILGGWVYPTKKSGYFRLGSSGYFWVGYLGRRVFCSALAIRTDTHGLARTQVDDASWATRAVGVLSAGHVRVRGVDRTRYARCEEASWGSAWATRPHVTWLAGSCAAWHLTWSSPTGLPH